MNKILIFLNGGNIINKKRLLKEIQSTTCVIAVDGGANYLHDYHIIPNILIGDMDSIQKDVLDFARKKGVEIIVYPREKDQTDSELALQYAVHHGAKEIIIVGFNGDRFDHMIANINYLSKLFTKIIIKIIQDNENIYFVNKRIAFCGNIGDEVSLIPLQTDAKGVYTKGLRYKLANETLKFASTKGISNELISPEAQINVKKGILMVMHRYFGI